MVGLIEVFFVSVVVVVVVLIGTVDVVVAVVMAFTVQVDEVRIGVCVQTALI